MPESLAASFAQQPKQAGSMVTGRVCGTCTLCCKVAGVLELSKPMGVWCRHCQRNGGCSIYDTRPASCRSFHCQWLVEESLGPEWKPERAKFALVKSDGGRRLTALVDPGYPAMWRRPVYYENLKQWAVIGASRWPDLHMVDVLIGSRSIVILPDRDVELGVLGPDEAIHLQSLGRDQMIEVTKVKAG